MDRGHIRSTHHLHSLQGYKMGEMKELNGKQMKMCNMWTKQNKWKRLKHKQESKAAELMSNKLSGVELTTAVFIVQLDRNEHCTS